MFAPAKYLLAAALAAAPLAQLCGGQLFPAPGCSEAPTRALGFAIDGGSNIDAPTFILIKEKVASFIETFLLTDPGPDRGNPFDSIPIYINTFSFVVYGSSSGDASNGKNAAEVVRGLTQLQLGDTFFYRALEDQLRWIQTRRFDVPVDIILITDGSGTSAFDIETLAALEAADVRLLCVDVGNFGVGAAILDQICALTALDLPLTFSLDTINNIAPLLDNTLDSDGDGVPDCEDDCPADPTRNSGSCDGSRRGAYGSDVADGSMYGDDIGATTGGGYGL